MSHETSLSQDSPYRVHSRQLERISKYQLEKIVVIIWLSFIVSVVGATMFLNQSIAFAALIILGGRLWMRLRIKHQMPCPMCTKAFFGEKFQLFMPHVSRCMNCGFSLYPSRVSS